MFTNALLKFYFKIISYHSFKKKKKKFGRKGQNGKQNTLHCIHTTVVKLYIDRLLDASVVSDSVRPHRWQPTKLPRP